MLLLNIFKQFKLPSLNRLNIQLTAYEDFYELYTTQSANASAKISLVVSNLDQFHFMNSFYKYDNWLKLEDFVIEIKHGCFVALQHSFYFKMIDKITNQLIDTGIMKKFVNLLVYGDMKFYKIKDSPEVLRMKDLSFGFNIWLGFCILSIVTYIFEHILLQIQICCTRFTLKRILKFEKVYPSLINTKKATNSKKESKTLDHFKVKSARSTDNLSQEEIICSDIELEMESNNKHVCM